MNSIEDQVRAATRAEASTLREVRPLRLPPDAAPGRAARPGSRPAGRAAGGGGWPRSPPPRWSSRSPSHW